MLEFPAEPLAPVNRRRQEQARILRSMDRLDRQSLEACVKYGNAANAQRIWDQAVARYEAELTAIGYQP